MKNWEKQNDSVSCITPPVEKWEVELDKLSLSNEHIFAASNQIHFFIRSLLAAHDEELRKKIESMKKKIVWDREGFCEECGFFGKCYDENHGCETHNETLNAVLQALNNH